MKLFCAVSVIAMALSAQSTLITPTNQTKSRNTKFNGVKGVKGYVRAPRGQMVRSECAHTVDPGTRLKRVADGLLATRLDGSQYRIPLCADSLKDAEKSSKSLPPEYDGWLTYTAYEAPDPAVGFDAFTSYFSVPTTLPKEEPEVLFIFPGLQDEDWIPKVDVPEPASGFDIIQPVLQYPGDYGDYWSVKSWYVTTDIGTVASTELRVDPGELIFGNMTRTGPTSWYIDSVVSSTGKSTNVHVDHPRLQVQPWAYNTVECYGCDGCDTYPTTPTFFTKIQLTSANGTNIEAEWLDTPKAPVRTYCQEAAVVTDPATVAFSFA